MTLRSLATSRYGKRYTRNRERTRSQISMIRGMTNSENNNKRQYERNDGLSRIRKIYR
jgi:predicted lipase